MSLDSLFGSSKKSQPTVTGSSITAPGYTLSGSLNNGQVSSSITPTGSLAQNAFATNFPQSLEQLSQLQKTVVPGYSQLRQAALDQINTRATSAISSLRDNLAQRRVLGSSFASDALSRANAEFAQQAAQAQGQSYLAELQASRDLITQKASMISEALNRELTQLGISSQYGLQLSDIISRNASAQAQIEAQKAAGVGQLLGTFSGLGLSSLGRGGAFGQGGAFGMPASSTMIDNSGGGDFNWQQAGSTLASLAMAAG